MTKQHWTNVAMTAQDCNGQPDPIPEGHNDVRIAALSEYQQTDEIDGVWLCDPDELDGDNAWTLGPVVDEIDWTGFPSSTGGDSVQTLGDKAMATTVIPEDVIEGFVAVRDTGQMNMFARVEVADLAESLGYDDTADWLRNKANRKAYGAWLCGHE